MSDCLRLQKVQTLKTYKNVKLVSFPSSFGSSPDKMLWPKLLEIMI